MADQTPQGQAAPKFKELAEKALPGSLQVQVFSNVRLFGDGNEMEAQVLADVRAASSKAMAESIRHGNKMADDEDVVCHQKVIDNERAQVLPILVRAGALMQHRGRGQAPLSLPGLVFD